MLAKKEGKIVVYLIDDDELHLKILQNKFSTVTDYKLHTFTSGEDFLEYIIKNPISKKNFNIVILDFLLSTNPDEKKNGVEILKVVKEIDSDIEVIMLSGHGDIETAISSMHHGAFTFIEKSENSFARIHNNIKWIVSEKSVKRKKNESMFTTKVFFILIVSVLIVSFVLYKIFPDLF